MSGEPPEQLPGGRLNALLPCRKDAGIKPAWVWPMRNKATISLLLVLLLSASLLDGCALASARCDRAQWVDRVEGEWLVLGGPRKAERPVRRTEVSRLWREGDAIVNGSVAPLCTARRRRTIRATRRALLEIGP